MGKNYRSHRNAKGPTPQLRSRNTRSKKGRLVTEISSSTTQLTAQLSLLGLYAAPTIGDGNCLFRALSDQLYGSPSKHHELRQQVCDHIARHKSRYEPFVEDERGLEGHLRIMRENATYGGHMELSAFAHMTKRNVKVIQPGLVYVIEWNAGGWDEASGSTTMATTATTADNQAESSTTPRRSTRRSSKSASPPKTKETKEDTRMKLGKGYFVYADVTSEGESKTEETEESDGATVYVAYHDWEHFSSIRNLRGPHTGHPNVVETPPPSMEEDLPTMTAKDREKARDRESKKEREKKENDRGRKEKEKKGKEKDPSTGTTTDTSVKVTLKLPPSLSASANASTASLPANSVAGTSAPASTLAESITTELQSHQDPFLIPLPISRSASPALHQIGSSSSFIASSTTSPLPSSSFATEVYPEEPSTQAHMPTSPEGLSLGHRPPHVHILQTTRSQYRSPKRTFDESSASGGEEDAENSKRSRRRVGSAGWSGQGVDGEMDGLCVAGRAGDGDGDGEEERGDVVDIVMHLDGDGHGLDAEDTPGLSAPGSSSSSSLSPAPSSVASSISGASSEVDIDGDIELESQVDGTPEPEDDATARLPVSPTTTATIPSPLVMPEGLGKKAKQKYLHMHPHYASPGNKPLTRRQRKALGLPKPPRKGAPSAPEEGSSGVSSGKIVIPGGKWKGRASVGSVVVDGTGADRAGEWRHNGTGRLDVRGFRELKI